MKEKEKEGKDKRIITIEELSIGPYTVNFVIRKEKKNNNYKNKIIIEEDTAQTKREKELDTKALESIRRKALQELESEETTAQQKIDAGWRLLYSYGFEPCDSEGNELLLQKKKSSNWLKGGF